MQLISENKGLVIALAIIICWLLLLWYLLGVSLDFYSPFTYLFILLQTHLYTGLFITSHDAMHGAVSPHKKINKLTGQISALLFAYNSFSRILPKHHQHHKHAGTEFDPDYYKGNFYSWYFSFLKQYITIRQIVLMALTYNTLILLFPQANVITFWITPSLLATLQLFYFGTFLPHKGEHLHDNQHKSRSLKKNHVLAFLTCYFFGYHYEHHNAPQVPWWQLYKEKK